MSIEELRIVEKDSISLYKILSSENLPIPSLESEEGVIKSLGRLAGFNGDSHTPKQKLKRVFAFANAWKDYAIKIASIKKPNLVPVIKKETGISVLFSVYDQGDRINSNLFKDSDFRNSYHIHLKNSR
jgi:hypothetical protein